MPLPSRGHIQGGVSSRTLAQKKENVHVSCVFAHFNSPPERLSPQLQALGMHEIYPALWAGDTKLNTDGIRRSLQPYLRPQDGAFIVEVTVDDSVICPHRFN